MANTPPYSPESEPASTVKDLKKQLLETQELLSIIMENNPFAIFWKDRDLIYQGSNQRFAEMAGFSKPDEVVGKTDYEMPWGVDNEIGAEACRSSDFRVIESGIEEIHIIEQIKQENDVVVWTDTSKVPIRDSEGLVIGVLGVLEDITPRKLIEQELEVANRKLKILSRIDSLTQVANRRYFDERISDEWSRAIRDKSQIAIILFDVDHFKKFNDDYGHPGGDKCLTLIAETAKNLLKRPSDLIARYGGEEFIILLPHVDRAGAASIAEKIRSAVENLEVELEGKIARVSVSLGFATEYPVRNSSPGKLISTADKALYRAKELGRNRVAGPLS